MSDETRSYFHCRLSVHPGVHDGVQDGSMMLGSRMGIHKGAQSADSIVTLSTFLALCSSVTGKPLQSQMVVLGSMSLGGNIIPVENLAESLQS